MCGITGILGKKRITRDVIDQMTLAVAHRGPDSQGVFLNDDETVALGHRRLSVIDLSTSANQPMTSVDNRYTIVFNGEIYNFKQIRTELEKKGRGFTTNSDTEVIINAFAEWNTGCFAKLQGMFAIALYDRDTRKTFLARDRMGKKPLYLYRDNERIAFASEIKSLLTIPGMTKKVNKAALIQFLHFGYIPEPLTAYENIEKFPAASVGVIDGDHSLTISRYWEPLKANVNVGGLSEQQLTAEFEQRLTDAVQSRLISDVPLGALLSGGTDSSLVCAVASKLVPRKLNTFTIGFEEGSFDESKYASKVAGILGTDHHLFMLKEKDAVELVEPCLEHFDEPIADGSVVPVMLISQHARRQVTVALTGDGGDELFLGYGSYSWASRVKKFGWTKPLIAPLSFDRRLNKANQMFATVPSDQVRDHIFSQEQGYFSANEVRELAGAAVGFSYTDPGELQKSTEEEKQAYFDLNYYLKDDLLVKVDCGSMKYALECRSPLLDQSIVELALQLPYDLKIRNNVTKYLLKKSLTKYLPEDLVYRKKWGFGIPLSKWLRSDLRYLVDTYLDKKVVERVGLVNADAVAKLVTRFNGGEHDLYLRIWTLVCLHYWWVKNIE